MSNYRFSAITRRIYKGNSDRPLSTVELMKELLAQEAKVERLEAKLETAEEAIRGGQNWAWYQWSIGETK